MWKKKKYDPLSEQKTPIVKRITPKILINMSFYGRGSFFLRARTAKIKGSVFFCEIR